jgi:predicted xylose isomerase-like sugar epimerase
MSSVVKQTSVRVAVVQAGSVPFQSEACVDKAVRLIEDAAAAGAKVIVFPEAFIGQRSAAVRRGRQGSGLKRSRICVTALAVEAPLA